MVQSALSSFIVNKPGQHPTISRFMTGLFNLKPVFSRYTTKKESTIALPCTSSEVPQNHNDLHHIGLHQDTIVRWIKQVMSEADINTKVFKHERHQYQGLLALKVQVGALIRYLANTTSGFRRTVHMLKQY